MPALVPERDRRSVSTSVMVRRAGHSGNCSTVSLRLEGSVTQM